MVPSQWHRNVVIIFLVDRWRTYWSKKHPHPPPRRPSGPLLVLIVVGSAVLLMNLCLILLATSQQASFQQRQQEQQFIKRSPWSHPDEEIVQQPPEMILQIRTKRELQSHHRLPTPIFVASLPKSATSSSWMYFNCGGYNAAHQWIKGQGKVGGCIEQNIRNQKPPFDGCGNYDVWTDTGHVEQDPICYQPAIQGLDAIYQSYPNSTIVLVTRDVEDWYQSISRLQWRQTFNKLHHCPGMPSNKGSATQKDDWIQFYVNHTQMVRHFAKTHPTMTYLEFAVEDPNVAQQMEQQIGINATCWGRQGRRARQKGDPKQKKNDDTAKHKK
jgi:Sulfotransferase domain